jgi:hypothetical protein
MTKARKGTAIGNIRICGEECERLQDARDTVSEMDGVKKAEANCVSGTLSVEYDPEKITLDAIRTAVKDELARR